MFIFYQITNSFFYCKSVAQADLFKLLCVKRVMAQVPVINTNSDSNTGLSSFLLYRSHDSKTKSVNKNYMDMKRILNYYKSDQVACFELLEP